MRASVIRSGEYARTPWKNGLGFTDQIAIHPAGADLRRGDFLWRVSTARIERASPFSPFPNHDRVLVVLEGGGVRLTHTYEPGEEPESVELPCLEPYEFPGDILTGCEPQGGPIQDLSVFFAKGTVSAHVELIEVTPEDLLALEPQGETHLFFVIEGELHGPNGYRASVGDSLRIELEVSQPIELSAGAAGARAFWINLSAPPAMR